ncbi:MULTISPECIES: aromatic amino acid ammonia-lyase [Pseudomonas]|uniref:tyrosine ammonia-lyase n=1 Tax=Pseudomonas donghuensis TaxID=1163398 RepID=A0AAP0SFF3_9PSED|nr:MULTISPECIES: aromatic amino acid ammonia-lyase [Pseudomonas]MDF9891230.1 histidine ammonia-lyase [Pseudomonas vranovensis]KDN99377.2 aromatic amino acid lyase [Pseudomonas donghuensis]MBS7598919.1 aromatic amino acid lyase [Pseudomonas sp. RC2C2]MCP6693221.1 aromatic amino acid ammonia-lyase [Pseudomonas donghuensis]MCP6696750.1 aromatic amino acid ammonia-lyase [Pseudomonas donghuensis]
MTMHPHKPVTFGALPLAIEDVLALAHRQAETRLQDDSEYRARIARGAQFLDSLLDKEGVIYGVTTGYGDSCVVAVPLEHVEALPKHLYTFHGCGLGQLLDAPATRAVLAARLQSLCHGVSGVRIELLERLQAFLAHDILPLIPQEGSVGASGDLTPLSYVAATLSGEREVMYRGERRSAADVHRELGWQPLVLRPKEALALMNGTAVMTGLACLAFARADYLLKLATRITALNVVALQGNPEHFDERLFAAKPHPGQMQVAAWLRQDLAIDAPTAPLHRLQDRYSLRCAPHVLGVLADSLGWLRGFIETELNSANDNPIIDAEAERVLHGGHFYGGHIAFAMDSLKNLVANVADLLDRQLALLVDVRYNHGLASNLSGASAERAMLNHGFKAVQIGASAWTAEALKNTMPASVFSRSTECHNQDKVSMGTIAARDALRVLELTEQVAAATLLAANQGVWLRSREADARDLPPALAEMHAALLEDFAPVIEDRALESDLRRCLSRIAEQHWRLHA